MPSESYEFEIEHKGKYYSVEADVDLEMEDDSFDHEFGTEERYSCAIEEWSASVFEINETGEAEEVDLESIEGLESAIESYLQEEVSDLDASDYFDKYGRDAEYDL